MPNFVQIMPFYGCFWKLCQIVLLCTSQILDAFNFSIMLFFEKTASIMPTWEPWTLGDWLPGLPTFTGAQMLFQLFKLCHFMLFSVKLKIMPFYSIFKATISKFSKLCHIMLFWYVFFFLRLRRLVLGKNKISKYLWTCETPPYSEKGWGEWGVYEWVYSKYLTVERNLTPWEIL